MPDPLLGAIGFETSSSFISRAIRWFTRGKWSHVFLVLGVDPITGRREIVEASTWGIQKAYLNKYFGSSTKTAIYRVDIPEERRNAALARCLGLVGRSYGYLQLVGFIPVLLLGRLGIKIKNPVSAGRVCSEFALRYLQHADIDSRFSEMDRDTTEPGDLSGILENHPAVHCEPEVTA